MNKVMRKLRSNIGESMAELLAALLIGALAMIMLADMVMVSSGILTSSKESYIDYITHLNVLSERNTNAPDAIGEVTIGDESANPTDSDVAMFVYEKRDTVIISFKKR